MFKSSSKYKNRLFAMMPHIDQTGQGISLAVLEENKKNVKGLRFVKDDCFGFKLSVKDFEKLLNIKKIDFAGEIPDDVLEEMSEIYLQKKKFVS